MRNLLVPIDGSVIAIRALRYAIELARNCNETRIILLNVQSNLERWYPHGLLNAEAMEHLRQEGKNEAAEALAVLDQSKVFYDFEVVFGHPAEVIVREAKDRHCESIVMGTRGLSDVESVFLGSTAYRVIELAEMPVVLVK